MSERDYKKEYREYHGTPEHIKERAQRVQARRDMIKAGRAHKGDGMDVDHAKMIKDGGSNALSNLREKTPHWNRGWKGRE